MKVFTSDDNKLIIKKYNEMNVDDDLTLEYFDELDYYDEKHYPFYTAFISKNIKLTKEKLDICFWEIIYV